VPYLLGIDIGSGSTRTALCRRTPGVSGWGPPEPVRPDVPVTGGGPLGLFGDTVPVLSGDRLTPPHVIVAELARRAADAVWEHEGEGPARVAVAHPTGWGPGRTALLRAALDDAGMGGVALVTRARAVVERHRAGGRPITPGRVLAVCRIGRAGIEIALAVPHEPGRLELLGSAEFGEAGGDDLAEAGPADARAILTAAADLLRCTALACGVEPAVLAAVLTAGGGAAHPLVAEVLGGAVPAPVLSDDDPRLTVAAGAALAVRPLDAPSGALTFATESVPEMAPALAGPAVYGSALSEGPGEMPPRPPLLVAAPAVGR
jgi:hypothetical protein